MGVELKVWAYLHSLNSRPAGATTYSGPHTASAACSSSPFARSLASRAAQELRRGREGTDRVGRRKGVAILLRELWTAAESKITSREPSRQEKGSSAVAWWAREKSQ